MHDPYTLFSNSSLRRKVPSHLLSLASLSEGAALVHVVLDGLSPHVHSHLRPWGWGTAKELEEQVPFPFKDPI